MTTNLKLSVAKCMFCIFLIFISATSFGQTKISLDSVKFYLNKNVIVCGKVFSTKTDEVTGTVFLDVGGKYPNAKLTVVIFQADLKNFEVNPEEFFREKDICVTGMIKKYKRKIEIVVRDGEELILN